VLARFLNASSLTRIRRSAELVDAPLVEQTGLFGTLDFAPAILEARGQHNLGAQFAYLVARRRRGAILPALAQESV